MDSMNAGSRIVNFIRDGSLLITLKYTTLVHMRSGYAWTMKSWQRSEWRLGSNSVLFSCIDKTKIVTLMNDLGSFAYVDINVENKNCEISCL